MPKSAVDFAMCGLQRRQPISKSAQINCLFCHWQPAEETAHGQECPNQLFSLPWAVCRGDSPWPRAPKSAVYCAMGSLQRRLPIPIFPKKCPIYTYRVSHSSRPNFVCIYLGHMWILPNILLTMLSARLGNFFEVWNTMVHARMPQKNAEWIFGWFSILVIFLPNFEDFKPILATLDKLQGNEMKNLISIVE